MRLRHSEWSFSRFFYLTWLCVLLSSGNGFGQDLDELLELDLSDLLKMEVVSASKSLQPIAEVPATVKIITNRMIAERGYQTLEDLLGDQPGFQFRNIQGFNSYSFLRGIPNQNNLILIMVDGILVNELNSGGYYGGGQYNLTNVKQVEIVYGPASALYGTNAVSGIINLITYDPAEEGPATTSLSLGNYQTKAVDFKYRLFKPATGFGFSISGMSSQTDKRDLGGSKGDYNWSDSMDNFEDDLSVDGKMVFKGWKMGFLFQDKQASRTTNYKSTGTQYLDFGTNWHIRFSNLYLKYAKKFQTKLNQETTLYYRDTTVLDDTVGRNQSISGEDSGQVGYYRPNYSLGLETQWDYHPTSTIQLIFGAVLETENLAESFSITYSGDPQLSPPAPSSPEMLENRLISGYLQGKFQLNDQWTTTLGLRHDDSDYYGSVDTPRAALNFLHGHVLGRVLYSEAFRAPRPWDFTFGLGNETLNPETMKTLEGSLGWQAKKNLFLEVTFFKNDVEDLLVQEALDSGTRWTNAGKLHIKGFEANLEWRKKWGSGFANYSWNSSEDAAGVRLPEIADNTANAGFVFKLSGSCSINARANFIGTRKNPNIIATTGDNKIESATVIHGTLSWVLGKHNTLRLMARNILDQTYYHPSNRPPNRYRQDGRNLLLKWEYQF